MWGADTNSGEIIYKTVLEVVDRLRVDVFSGAMWDAYLSPYGLVVVQVMSETSRIHIQRSDMETGKVLAEGETKMGGPSLHIGALAWTKDNDYFVINRDLYNLNYETLALDVDWP